MDLRNVWSVPNPRDSIKITACCKIQIIHESQKLGYSESMTSKSKKLIRFVERQGNQQFAFKCVTEDIPIESISGVMYL